MGLGEISAVACGLLWAIALVLFRKSGESAPPVPLNVFKNAVATVLFFATALVLGVDLLPATATPKEWVAVAASGVLGIGVADSLFFAALNRLGAGRVAIVECAYSPLILIASLVYLHEPLGVGVLVAMPPMIAAIVLGSAPGRGGERAAERPALRSGVVLGLLSVVFLATGVVLAKPVLLRHDAWWVTTVRISAGMVFLGVQGMLPRHRRATLRCFRPGPLWRVAVPAAFLGSYLAMFIWLLGFQRAETATAGVLNQLSTIFVIVLATIFLREPLTLRKAAAVGLAVLAAVVAVW